MSEVKTGLPPDASPSKAEGGQPAAQTNFLSKFKQLLTEKDFEIPIEANFIINIPLSKVLTSTLQQINNSDVDSLVEPTAYNVTASQRKNDDILSKYTDLGFVYANKITLPGEQLNNTRVGLDAETSGILLPLPILKNRTAAKTLSLDILETNSSFLEAYIRPWIIITSLYGMHIRNADDPQNIKLNILEVIQFDRKRNIRKQLNFFNVVPVSISENSLAYGLGGGKKVISTNWLFENYSVIST